jgi:uncharacterized protein
VVDPLSPTVQPGSTPRTRLRRIPEKAVHDREALYAVLDAGLVAHVAVVAPDGQPFVLPVGYARDGDRVLFHGSSGSRLFLGIGSGAPTCLTVTLLDGLVLARSAFESSMHYRSAMVLGSCTVLHGPAKLEGMRVITEHLLPGRWAQVRPPLQKELAATTLVALSLAESSVKISNGPPGDPPEDVLEQVWAGTVPLTEQFGEPVDAPDLAFDLPVPDYVRRWRR